MGKAGQRNDRRSKKSPSKALTSTKHGIRRRQHSQNGNTTTAEKYSNVAKRMSNSKQQALLKIPFLSSDRVLLLGEGDYSFALSLARHHKVESIIATSFDNKETLAQKYPGTQASLQLLTCQNQSGDLADEDQPTGPEDDVEWAGFSSDDDEQHEDHNNAAIQCRHVEVLHNVDATALSTKHKKQLTPLGPFTKIVFNFPHTGGLSTDVNRQVRANQKLLVGFFNSAKPYLATKARPAKASNEQDSDEEYDSEGNVVYSENDTLSLSQGRILVTIFEGEPYTLWNVRDLARHCGLQVVESFKFPWAAYPGYKHARTIGDITSGKDRSAEGRRKGAWRGEERDARCYVLALKEESTSNAGGGRKRKRTPDGEDDD